MDKLSSQNSQGNVNVTLGSSDPLHGESQGKEFPCPLCGAGLPILISKRQKPYCTCNLCGVQIFVRGKAGIARLNEMANAGIFISVKTESASHGISLLNRLEQLKLQKRELQAKQGFILIDKKVANVISLVDVEMEKIEGELAKISVKTKGEPNK